MKNVVIGLFVVLVLLSGAFAQEDEPKSKIFPFSDEYDANNTLLMAIGEPYGYKRSTGTGMNTYMAWITNLPMRPKGSPVSKWNGQRFMNADSVNGVIDLGIGTTNQKNADIPIQLLLEYFRARDALYDFPIIVGNRDTVIYNKWLNGKYLKDPRMNLIYEKGAKKEHTLKEFYRFLEFVLVMNENKTIIKNLEPVKEKNLMPGDLFIQFNEKDVDSSGHSSIIFDIAANEKGEKMYLAGWGGTPPHSLYVARPLPISHKQWFTMDELKEHLAEYGMGKFYRFASVGKLDKK
jgi:hypothetical protein